MWGIILGLYFAIFKQWKDQKCVGDQVQMRNGICAANVDSADVPCKGEDVIARDNDCIPKPGAYVEDICGKWERKGFMENQYYDEKEPPHIMPTNFWCKVKDPSKTYKNAELIKVVNASQKGWRDIHFAFADNDQLY